MYLKQRFLERKTKLFKYAEGSSFGLPSILMYSFIFIIVSAMVFYSFVLCGKVLIHDSDSLAQDYVAFLYWREYLRDFISNLIHNHKIILPMWDNNIGMGADVLTTLHYYIIGDPLNLLSALAPMGYTDICFSLLSILKIYLAGLFFVRFSTYHKNSNFSAIAGALVYVFSAYVLCAGIKHVMFLAPLVYFPLVILGMDMLFDENKPGLFIVGMVLSAYSNFYFFYMICIFVIVYWMVKEFSNPKNIDIKSVAICGVKFLVSAVCSILIASPVLIPIAIQLFSTNRASIENVIPLMYEPGFYANMLSGFMTADNYWVCYWAYLGFGAIGLYSVAVIFSYKNRFRELKILFIVAMISACIPFIGHIINGFSYPCDRWSFAIAMLVAYFVCKAFPLMSQLSKENIKIIFGIICIYTALFMLIPNIHSKNAFAMLFLLFLIFATSIASSGNYISKNVCKAIIFIALILGISQLGKSQFSLRYDAEMDMFANRGFGETKIFNESVVLMEEIDDANYRFEKKSSGKNMNTQMLMNKRGISYYYSLCNGYISQFFDEMEISAPMEYRIIGLDLRGYLQELCNVRYVLANKEDALMPQGYNAYPIVNGGAYDGGYYVFENENPLPIGYFYDSYIDRSDYEKLSAVNKQEVMMQSVVTDEKEIEQVLDTRNPVFGNVDVEYNVECSEGVSFSNGKIDVVNDGAEITFKFDGISNSETYLEVLGLDFEGYRASDIYLNDSSSRYDREIIKLNDEFYMSPETPTFTLLAKNNRVEGEYRTKRSTSYCGRHNFIYNLGYSNDGINEIKMHFNTVGKYRFDSLKIMCQSMENEANFVNKLSEGKIEKLEFNTNSITANVTTNEDKLLCLSLPYSSGFTAYVDGAKTEVYRVNTMFLGLLLDAGSHDVRLEYTTPGLKIGIVLLFIGIVFAIILSYVLKKGLINEKRKI